MHPRLLPLVLAIVLAASLPAASVAEGVAAQRAGRLPEAESAFRAILAGRPDDPQALYHLATVVGWQGRHAESEALWERALAQSPADPDVVTGLARVRYWRGDLERAAATIAPLTTSQHADALALAGDIARARGQHREARQHYAAAQRLVAPGSPESSGLDAKMQSLPAADARPWAIRLDAGLSRERYTGDRGRERGHALAAAWSWRGLGSISAGYDSRLVYGQREERLRMGLAGAPLRGLEIEASYAWTPGNDVDPGWETTLDATWSASAPLRAVAGWRHSDYDDDRIDLLRPGLRWHPLAGAWSDSHVELRWIAAFSAVNRTTHGMAVRVVADTGTGLSGYAGYANGDEASPPNPSARVATYSAGLVVDLGRAGWRLDGLHERRVGAWGRDGISTGVFVRW
jgi:YaiO family outer membrane protein